MNILVLGGTGLLGKQLVRTLAKNHKVETLPTRVFDAANAENCLALHKAITSGQHDAVVNCVGLTPQSIQRLEPLKRSIEAVKVNALFPHVLARMTASFSRLIHISTDCVFDGKTGNYDEFATPAPLDLYGRSKALGEILAPHVLTIRTSFIGYERRPLLQKPRGLVDWFFDQHGSVAGFQRMFFSGLTTIELSRRIDQIITLFPKANGILHVGGPRISKYDLLRMLSIYYPRRGVTVRPVDAVQLDRSLNSDKFYEMISDVPVAWESMLAEMAKEQPL